MSKLYVVATPIGNMDDITYRAINILKSVNTILCEDTRITSRLLQKYQINDKKLVIYNDHSGDKDRKKIAAIIEQESEVALVSDAGTPNISDPGQVLVKFLATEDVQIVPIPGCSSLTTAICASTLDIDKFCFLGFLPTGDKKVQDLLTKIDRDLSFVFLERSSRLIKSLQLVKSCLGPRKVTIARELTKIHEQIINDDIQLVIEYFDQNTDKLRGEFVVIVEKSKANEELNIDKINEEIEVLLLKNLKTKEVSEILSLKYNVNKKIIYDLILQLKK